MACVEKTKKGLISKCALNLGGTQFFEANGMQLTLWGDPQVPVYHVRQHDFETGKRVFWQSFPSLTAARKRYQKALQTLK